jgi:hypothetical protein
VRVFKIAQTRLKLAHISLRVLKEAHMAHRQTDGARVFALWDNKRTANNPKRPRDPAQLAKLMIEIASGEVENRPTVKQVRAHKAGSKAVPHVQRRSRPSSGPRSPEPPLPLVGGRVARPLLRSLPQPSAPERHPRRPAECIGAVKHRVEGDPDPKYVSTSFAERSNLSGCTVAALLGSPMRPQKN